MNAKKFREIYLAKLGLTQQECADVLFVKLRSVQGYANGKPIPKRVEVLLRYYEKYGTGLAMLMLKK